MNNIKIFSNDEFGQIRTLVINEQPWFVGKDVATIPGYKDTRSAIQDHVDEEDKTTEVICLSGSTTKAKQSSSTSRACFSLILSSKLPLAKCFKRWVT